MPTHFMQDLEFQRPLAGQEEWSVLRYGVGDIFEFPVDWLRDFVLRVHDVIVEVSFWQGIGMGRGFCLFLC